MEHCHAASARRGLLSRSSCATDIISPMICFRQDFGRIPKVPSDLSAYAACQIKCSSPLINLLPQQQRRHHVLHTYPRALGARVFSCVLLAPDSAHRPGNLPMLQNPRNFMLRVSPRDFRIFRKVLVLGHRIEAPVEILTHFREVPDSVRIFLRWSFQR